MSQSRNLTSAEEALISLIENNSKAAKPSQPFITALNKIIRDGSGSNPGADNDKRIYFDNHIFMQAFRKRVLVDRQPSTQMIFEIAKALCEQKTFGESLEGSPIRTAHIFNYLYEELVKRHQFYVQDGVVSSNIPPDINALNYELLQFFRKADPTKSEQTMCNCVLVKIAPNALSNVATEEQIEKLVSGLRNLETAPQVPQTYFDKKDKNMAAPSPLVKSLQSQYKVPTPEVTKPRRTHSVLFRKKPDKKEEPIQRSKSEPVKKTPGIK